MRIPKRSMARKTISAPPAVQHFIKQVLEAQEDNLPDLLRTFDRWTFPKGDLFQWIDVLDKCDNILERLCKAYELSDVQLQQFKAQDKALLVSIVSFSVFLLDHCANRSLYSSGNNINELLNTTDLDVLEQTCRIALRLAQRASQRRGRNSVFALSTDKLRKLATSLQHASKEYGAVPIAMESLIGSQRKVDPAWLDLNYWYYTTGRSKPSTLSPAKRIKDISATPVQSGSVPKASVSRTLNRLEAQPSASDRSGEGLMLVELSAAELKSMSIEEALLSVFKQHDVPTEQRYDLMLRMRFCKYASDDSHIQQMVNARVLALAALAYSVSEPVLQSRLISIDTGLVGQLIKLCHPDNGASEAIRTSVLSALEAMAHHRSKLGEVLAGLGASLSHGLLMNNLRETLADLDSANRSTSNEYVEALFNLLHYLSTTNVAGSMLCSAGLVQALIRLLQNSHEGALRSVVKSLTLLDHLLYGFPQSFQIFCDAHGLDILVERIQAEIEHDMAFAHEHLSSISNHADYQMTHERFSLLKTMLKFIVHMMQSAGTAEGLRNLIETSLLKSIRNVFSHASVFGSSIFASSTNIMATFIHNEPTSFQILHEAHLPAVFLESVSRGIFPASDSLTAIPNAFGAICLNSQGLELFNELQPLAKFFKIFTSLQHCEVLRDSDIGGMLGNSLDEFVRHQPSLKSAVLSAILNTIQDIFDVNQHLQGSPINACHLWQDNDNPDMLVTSSDSFKDEDGVQRSAVVAYIDVIARFLEGFLQNSNHAKDFMAQEGMQRLLALYDLSCLPYDFAKSHAALSLSHIFRLTCELNATSLLNSIFNKLAETLSSLEEFFNHSTKAGSYFENLTQGHRAADSSDALVLQFQKSHTLCVLLSDLYATPVFAHGRSTLAFYSSFASESDHARLLEKLGDFHRRLVWEDILFSSGLPDDWLSDTQPKDDEKADTSQASTRNSLDEQERHSAKFRNTKMIRFFVCQIPPCIVPFFQGLTKMLINGRRIIEHAHRITSIKVASQISEILVSHLNWSATEDADRKNKQSYLIMMLTVTQMILCDERNHSVLMTILLLDFELGLKRMATLLTNLYQDLSLLPLVGAPTADELQKAEGARLSGAIKLILHLFQQITSRRSFLESPQTLHLDSKERNKDKPGFFHPREFLDAMRRQILSSLETIWSVDRIQVPLPDSIVKVLIVVIAQCVAGDSPYDEEALMPTTIATNTASLPRRTDAEISRTGAASHAESRHTNVLAVPSHTLDEGSASVSATDEGNRLFDPSLPRLDARTFSDALGVSLASTEPPASVHSIRTGFFEKVIEILSTSTDSVFELSDLTVALYKTSNDATEWLIGGLRLLIHIIREKSSQPAEARSSQNCAVAHFLAKLTYEEVFWTRNSNEISALLPDLLVLLDNERRWIGASTALDDPKTTIDGEGIANLLVVLDSYMLHSEGPHSVSLDRFGSMTTSPNREFVSLQQMQFIMEFCVAMLTKTLDKTALISLLRLLVRLTKKFDLMRLFLQLSGIEKLLGSLKMHIKDCDENIRITAIVILRHAIENEDSLHHTMQREITAWFQNKPRSTEVSSFVKQHAALALRNPTVFISEVERLCQIPKYDPNTSLQAIALISRDAEQLADTSASETAISDGQAALQKSGPLPAVSAACQSDSVLYALLQALTQYHELVVEQSQPSMERREAMVPAPDAIVAQDEVMLDEGLDAEVSNTTSKFQRADHPEYLYTLFILQSMTELLASYPQCKHDFVSYSTHLRAPGAANTRTAMVNYFANDLIAYQSPKGTEVDRKKALAIQHWAKAVLVSLCTEPLSAGPTEDLQQIRRLTLDVIQKCFKDATISTDVIELRYNRLSALSELIVRLLTLGSTTVVPELPSPSMNEMNKDLAKLMIEKNFVANLSQTMAEIDLQYPLSRRVIKGILKPLRLLTKMSIRLNESNELISPSSAGLHEPGEEIFADTASVSGDEIEVDQPREDTPDLYRNSALGMFGAEIHDPESENSIYTSNEDEAMYDEMDFDEDGSETGSAVSDEDLGLGGEEHMQHDVEIILDADGDDDDDDGDDEDEDDSQDSEDEISEDDEAESSTTSSLSPGDRAMQDNTAEANWEQESGEFMLPASTPVPESIMHELRESFIDGSGRSIVEVVNEGSYAEDEDQDDADDEDVEGSEADEELLMRDGVFNGEAPEDQWDWDDTGETSNFHEAGNGRSIASRLWASLAPGNNGRSSGFQPEFQLLQRPRVGLSDDYQSRERLLDLSNPVLSGTNGNAQSGRQDRPRNDEFTDWIESIEALIGGGAVQLIGDIMSRPGQASRTRTPAIRVEVSSANELRSHFPASTDRTLPQTRSGLTTTAPTENLDDPMSASSFTTKSTLRRYQDEAVIMYSSRMMERALFLVNYVLAVLLPIAIEQHKIREREEAARLLQLRSESGVQNIRQTGSTGDDAAPGASTAIAQGIDLSGSSRSTESRPMTTVQTIIPSNESETAPTQSDRGTRQTVQLRGHSVDVTDLGIDLEFLEALPEDMREEVLTQHIRERRASAQVTQQPSADLTPEFLEALPAELRAELMQQEAADRRRQARLAQQNEISGTNNAVGSPLEIDPASFLASLDPALRQSILVEQDEEFLDQLPPDMLAELAHGRFSLGDRNPSIAVNASSGLPRNTVATNSGLGSGHVLSTESDKKVKREIAQLLTKAGVSALLRLIFLPSAPQKNILHDILLNLCENRSTRSEILGQLLVILLDGTVDVSSNERCFATLTRRSKSGSSELFLKTPKSAPHSSSARHLPLLSLGLGSSPALVALQCLQALTFLVTWNDRLPSFFLTEYELSGKKSIKTKSKHKEAPRPSKYPINSVLVLLDRPNILADADVLELLANLLSSLSRPLLLLLKKDTTMVRPDIAVHLEEGTTSLTTTAIPPLDSNVDGTSVVPKDALEAELQHGKARKALLPPDIPPSNLQLIINIITAEACSGKTFQHTLATIHHLSALEGAYHVLITELLRQASTFIVIIESDLQTLLDSINATSSRSDIHSQALCKFSSANSYQAKLLRILKSIDYADSKLHPAEEPRTESDTVPRDIYGTLNVELLWARLSQCLEVIHGRMDMIHVATVLLPLIEALMVVCKCDIHNESKIHGYSRQATPARGDTDGQIFFTFTEKHKKILNQMVRNNPTLMSGSFSLLTKNPKVLEFDNKRNYFCRRVRDRSQHRQHYQTIQLNVRREAVFLDSYKDLHFKNGDEIKYSKLNIRFAGEEGIDAGGVSREWFQVLARQMFDPNYALFVPVNADRNTYHPNKTSGINPEHLLFFKFVGRIVGKALYDGRLLDCHFSRPVYRKILGKKVSLKDMETLDLEYYKSLVWMLENDITDVITETFSVERDDFGVFNIIDLIHDGRNIAVTEQNKHEYVSRVTEYRLLESVSDQLESFMQGFNDIIPADLVSIFNEQELELLISGLPDIDADDWKNNTDYHNYTAASPQIQWFWRAVRSFDDEERARLLQFSTGSSRIPIEGFAHLEGMHGVQKFNIHRDYSSGSRLPQSHTCFNQLDLPEYESYEVLRSSLLIAISEGSEGFGFA